MMQGVARNHKQSRATQKYGRKAAVLHSAALVVRVPALQPTATPLTGARRMVLMLQAGGREGEGPEGGDIR